jgi:hypothetical protein
MYEALQYVFCMALPCCTNSLRRAPKTAFRTEYLVTAGQSTDKIAYYESLGKIVNVFFYSNNTVPLI